MPVKVLFVCYANVCRSPLAEAVFRHKVAKAGLSDQIHCDSAGVGYLAPGAWPHSGTVEILDSHDIEINHRSRRITAADLDRFDYILALDSEVLRSIWSMGRGRAVVEPLLKYAPNQPNADVPDPVVTHNFSLVYNLVDISTDGLLDALRQHHSL